MWVTTCNLSSAAAGRACEPAENAGLTRGPKCVILSLMDRKTRSVEEYLDARDLARLERERLLDMEGRQEGTEGDEGG